MQIHSTPRTLAKVIISDLKKILRSIKKIGYRQIHSTLKSLVMRNARNQCSDLTPSLTMAVYIFNCQIYIKILVCKKKYKDAFIVELYKLGERTIYQDNAYQIWNTFIDSNNEKSQIYHFSSYTNLLDTIKIASIQII